MTMRTIPGRPAYIADNGSGVPVLVKGGTGKVYAETDTTLSTPLQTYNAGGQAVPAPNSNVHGMVPDFWVDIPADHLGVIWHDTASNTRIWLPTKEGGKGDKGDPGKDGTDGRDGVDGTNGRDGSNVLPTDQAVSDAITTPGSPANTALSATIASEVAPLEGALSFPALGSPAIAPRYRASTTGGGTGTAATVNKPAGTVPGDSLVVIMRLADALPSTPAGWVLEGQTAFASGTTRAAVFSRVVSINDPASYTFTFTASSQWWAHALAFSGADLADPITAVTFNQISTAGTVFTAPSVSLAKRGFWAVAVLGQTDGATGANTPAGGWSKRSDGSAITTFTRTAGNSMPSGTQDITRTASDTGVAVSIAVASRAPMFRNTFESGDLTGYTQSLQNGPAAPVVVADPFGGTLQKLTQFDVLAGQTRQELITGGTGATGGDALQFVEGDDLYFASSYWLAPDFPVGAAGSWLLAHQWLTPPLVGTETAGMGLAPGHWGLDKWCLSAAGFPGLSKEAHSLLPITRGAWTKFVIRIKFSTDPAASTVQAWASVGRAPLALVFDSDNKAAETINNIAVETRPGWWPSYTGETPGAQGGTYRTGSAGGYEKHGIYRDSTKPGDTRFYSGGIRWGRSLAEVLG